MKFIKINTNVLLNTENGQNDNIKFHILDDSIMTEYGFNFTYGKWYFCLSLTEDITLNISIFNENGQTKGIIDVLDDVFMQAYDFQNMIVKNGNTAPSIAKKVQNEVYEIMNNLVKVGIISGWNYGDYI
jgi:hypothetical protein